MSPAQQEETAPAAKSDSSQCAAAVNHATASATTPTTKRASAQAKPRPKSAPAAPNRASTHKRKQPEPSLLVDFFLGRPSPARVAAQREAWKQRRKSISADAAHVREELRQEMRAAAMRRLQQPGRVADKVLAWQKKNAEAMKAYGGGVPRAEDAATEPTEVAVNLSPASVTEEDRMRIGGRDKVKKKKPMTGAAGEKDKENQSAGEKTEGNGQSSKARLPSNRSSQSSIPLVVKTAPKKRIVSDDHWMKRGQSKTTPSASSPAKPKVQAKPAPIPKDFLKRTAQNPSVQSKIRDWAQRLETSTTSPPPPRVRECCRKKSADKMALSENSSSSAVTSDTESTKTPEAKVDNGKVKTAKPTTSKSDVDDGIRVKPLMASKSKPDINDRIRVTPVFEKEQKGSNPNPRPMQSTASDDGIRVRALDDPKSGDGIRVQPLDPSSEDDKSVEKFMEKDIAGSKASKKVPTKKTADKLRQKKETEQGFKKPSQSMPGRKSPIEKTADVPTTKEKPVEGKTTTTTVKSSEAKPFKEAAEKRLAKQKSVERKAPYSSSKTTPVERNSSPSRPASTPKSSGQNILESNVEDETPVKRRPSRRHSRRRPRSPSPARREEGLHEKQHRESYSDLSGDESDRVPPTILGNKSLPEIPFGSSAFSVLDLSLGTDPQQTKKPKPQRTPSLKAVPKVIKKVVAGAKEILQESLEPPRPPPTANKPQTIESWLNSTVDPFVDAASPPTVEPIEREAKAEPTKPTPEAVKPPIGLEKRPPSRAQQDSRQHEAALSTTPKPGQSREKVSVQSEDHEATTSTTKTTQTPQSVGLRRSKATRKPTIPTKPATKNPLRDFLKEAFSGESGKHKFSPTEYHSCEADKQSAYLESDWDSTEEPQRRPGPAQSDYSSAYGSTLSSETSSHPPPRRRPPTNGIHELSTIASEEPRSVATFETASDVSQSTITRTTAVAKPTEVSRQRSQKCGLKRRLTKHSDLVSVLSHLDDGHPPARSRSARSSRSIRRKPSKASRQKADDLLEDFADDEYYYGKELKTLVDGVIPVLLRDIMNGDFGGTKADVTAKSVVNMGMTLEKLKNSHKQVPLADLDELFVWLDNISSIYDHYFDVWRLGFHGIIINLAPRLKNPKDNDSLLEAVSWNEDGDVIMETGERVDVAFLLKRPLVRVKWIVKFLKAAVEVTGSSEARRLVGVYEDLQQKARKRYREETARMMDEDANNTDTTRCRDLRTLFPLEGVVVNKLRQVVALDVFELDLRHSSGQRLECRVELIFRDNPALPSDKGDILIREIGNGTRSWLLFPPVPRQYISARRDDDGRSLTAMIRGTHNGIEWYELLKFSSTSEEQIDYWLNVLGTHPLPPTTRSRPVSMVVEPSPSKPDGLPVDIPVGERRLHQSRTETREDPQTHPQHDSQPAKGSSTSPLKTVPSQHPPQAPRPGSTPIQSLESSPIDIDTPRLARPTPNSTPYRADGAPPPPIHRTLGPLNSGLLVPPVDFAFRTRLRRKTSSPLKHEYHPSDVSSESSSSLSSDEDDVRPDDDDDSDEVSSETSESSSSEDELEDDEIPDTIPGYSIKEDSNPAATVFSENTILPEHSASQVAGAADRDQAQTEPDIQRFVASVSYWSSRKGVWKDINDGQPASILVHPGCMEVHVFDEQHAIRQAYQLQTSSLSRTANTDKEAPLILLVLTPVVMIRRSTAVDLEVRSPASPESRLKIDATMFRFRAANLVEAKDLYDAVHFSRLNNSRYIQLSEEARVRAFGQMHAQGEEDSMDGDNSSHRRSWFGRKNSYRASARAPSVSQGSLSTTISAGSFLRRLLGGGNNSFNIDESSIDRQSHPASHGGPGLCTPSGYSLSGTNISPPRSVSLSGSGKSLSQSIQSRLSNGFGRSPDNPFLIRCHLNVANNRWLDKGDCILHISRPPPGVRQELSLYNGLEKRIVVTHATKKQKKGVIGGNDEGTPLILLDAVLGSKCFSMLGSKGIMCSVWENLRDEEGNIGVAPRNGAIAGRVTKWCFQCKSGQQAQWIMGLLTAEVPGLI